MNSLENNKSGDYSMNMLTGKEIMAVRKELGLSMTEFAARLKVTESTVWKWENSDHHPRWGTMQKINELKRQLDREKAPA
jgi:DNA-binding transcriptional regulator YiaG